MSFSSPLRSLKSRFRNNSPSRRRLRSAKKSVRSGLGLEPLEDRRVLAQLQILSMTVDNASLAEHNFITGDDRGSIALSDTHVFYTGDSSTGAFPVDSVGSGFSIGVQYDALAGDIGSGTVYSLGTGPTSPMGYGGGTVTHLIELDGATGSQTGNSVALSSPISISYGAGIFAGNDKIVLWNNGTGEASAIDTASGSVTNLGTVFISMNGTENWAQWGVAEEFGGDSYLTYLQSSSVVRTRISDGATSAVADFPNGLSDMAVFTVSPELQRWYFHFEGCAGAFNYCGDETIGYADAIIQTGLSVKSSLPANGEIVTTTPSDFVIQLSSAYDPATVTADDLTVNGIPADSVDTTVADTLTFHYLSSPVISQGLQSMHMNEGSVVPLDGTPALAEFNASFRYDTLRLAVSSTEPADGSVVELPLTTLRVHFNEEVDPASVDPSDLTLSLGTVTAATPVAGDASSVDYTVSGLSQEGTLTVAIAAGAITDPYGNPALAYAGSYILDFGTVPYPLPMTAKAPLGSLIYDPSVTSNIAPAGDTDSFTIEVDAGQTITVRVTPDAGLQPTIELYDPSSTLIGSSGSSGAGTEAILQTAAAATGGTYVITVGGAGGTADAYTVQIILNAAVEDEAHGGPTNDDLGSAQSIDASFIDLGSGESRGAVLGKALGGAVLWVGFESSVALSGGEFDVTRITPSDFATQSLGDFGVIVIDDTNSLSILQSRASDISEFVSTGGGLVTDNGGAFDFSWVPNAADLTWTSANGDDVFLTAAGATHPVTAGLTNAGLANWGNSYHTLFTATGGMDVLTVSSTDLASTLAGGFGSGRLVYFGLHPTGHQPIGESLPLIRQSVGWAAPEADSDFYAFSLENGQSATVAVKGSGGRVDLELQDAFGTRLALATGGASNLEAVISNFVAPIAGTYYVRIAGGGQYSLVVTRDADFDTENNNNPLSAQSLDPAGAVLGHVSSIGKLLGADDGDRNLLLVDPNTGTSAIIASNVGGDRGFNDLALNPATGVLYGSQSLNSWALYTIDTVSFAETYVGDLGGNVRALAWSPDGATLYGFRNSEFGTIDPGTAEFTVISDPSIGFVGGMAFQPGTGTLFVVTNIRGALGLYTLDPTTGTASYVGDPGADYNSLEFLADGTLLAGVGRVGANPGFLIELDPATAAPTLIGQTVPYGFTNLTALESLPATDDYYSISVNAGNSLVLTTTTPANGPGEFVNTLDPRIELIDPTGASVASDDDGAADGRNAQLSHTALLTGTYLVRVSATAPTQGEYVLSVTGATGALPAFTAVATDPADGDRLRGPTTQMTVDFSDTLLLTSLQAADLTVNGMPAVGVTVVDGNTVVFDLPALSEGTQNVQIAAGAIQDVQGTLISAFNTSFYEDITAPRVIASSIQQGDVLPVGSLTYTVDFSEPMNTANLDSSDFELRGNFMGVSYPADASSWNPSGTQLTLQYSNLPQDAYTLTLLSGNTQLEDLVGWDLDGERLASPLPPNQSGNGVEGGDFAVGFALDITKAPFPTPLAAERPLGSLVYDSTITGVIAPTGDSDSFTLSVDPGQTITVVVSSDATLQPKVELSRVQGKALVRLGSASAGAAGQDAVIQTVRTAGTLAGLGPIPQTYQVTVSGLGGTNGRYDVQVILNAAVENENHDGPPNDTRATAQDLTGAFLSLNSATATGNGPERAAVLGQVRVGTSAGDVFVTQLYDGTIIHLDSAGNELDRFSYPGGYLFDVEQGIHDDLYVRHAALLGSWPAAALGL